MRARVRPGSPVTFPALPAEVVQAIARHTVGAPEMTDLDQVVYLADMIEPARTYPGVEKLREAVGDGLALGALRPRLPACRSCTCVRTRRRIHPETVAVWNSLVAGGPR